MNGTDVANVAAELDRAERTRQPIHPLNNRFEGMDVVDAYRVQLFNIGRKLDAGARVVGHKVGLSSSAMQRMMAVDEPDYGHLLDSMRLDASVAVDTTEYIQPRVEVEVCVVLGATLPGVGCTVDDVRAAVEYVAPSIELIDSRIAEWRIGIVDTIADNASSAGFILGERRVALQDIDDIRLIAALLWRNGELIETGASGAVLGNPLASVAWLANKVASFGVELRPGDIILPGSCTRAVDVSSGDDILAEFGQLGPVRLRFS